VDTGISSLLVVSISIVVTGSLWSVLDAVTKEAKEMFVEDVGDMPILRPCL